MRSVALVLIITVLRGSIYDEVHWKINPWIYQEQYFIMRPNVVVTRYFKLYPTNDQAAKYVCFAILKDSDFLEVDRAECQFTTATVIDNGTQTAFEPPKNEIEGFFESIEDWWHMLWEGMVDFITKKSCRKKCSRFFDFNCHVHYICMSWMLMFGLFLAIFPTEIKLGKDNYYNSFQKYNHHRKYNQPTAEVQPPTEKLSPQQKDINSCKLLTSGYQTHKDKNKWVFVGL